MLKKEANKVGKSLPRGYWQSPKEELGGLTPDEWLGKTTGFGPNGKYTRYQWFSNPELAKELGKLLNLEMTTARIKGQGHKLGWNKIPDSMARINEIAAKKRRTPPKPPRAEKYNKPLKLQGDMVIASCWHVPYWSQSMAQRLMDIAQGFKIKQLLIPGDFLNMGAFAKYFPSTKEVTTKQEFTSARELLEWLLTRFDKIYVCRGNHEDRLWTKALDREIPFEEVGAFCGGTFRNRVKWTPYAYALVKNGKKTWRVTHPGSYSRIPARVAQALTLKFEQNVISAHGHLMGWSPSLSAKYNAVDAGGLVDPAKVDYIGLRDTTHPKWITGFVVLHNGYPYIFCDLYTDWKLWYQWLGFSVDER